MQPQLTISLLASKQIHAVRRCLDSLIPILMQIPSELIIVNTSENDSVRELALQYTPYVIPFHWCDDFSKARNTGLQMAQGEWFLFIDDDEWFEDPSEIIEFFASGEYLRYYTARYSVRNYTDWMGVDYTEAHLNRMIRRTPDTKFKNPIHEYLYPFTGPTKTFSAYVHHYGYIKNIMEAKSLGRNIPLLEKELEEHIPTIHNCMQLSQEYLSVDEFEKAETYAWKCIELEEPNHDIGKNWCIALLPYMIRRQKEYQRAWETGKQMLCHPQCTEIAALRIYTDLMEICRHLKNREKDIVIYAKAYHQYLGKLDARPEQWFKQAVGTLGEQQMKSVKNSVYLVGFQSAIQIEDFKSAMFFLQCLPWENGGAEKLYIYFCDILRDKKREDFLIRLFNQLDISDPFVFIVKSRSAWKNGNQEEAKKWFELAVESDCTFVFMEASLLAFQSQGEISLKPVLSHTDIIQLEDISAYLTKHVDIAQLPDWINRAELYLSDFPVHSLSLLIAFQEKLLVEGILEIEDSELFSEIQQYCQWVQQYCSFVYSKHMQSSEHETLMPANYRFAVQMEQVFQDLELFNYPQVLQKLHEVINTYRPLCGVVRRMLSIIADKMNEPEQANSEFLALAAQVKKTVQDLIQEGRREEALPLVQQLSSLLPRDLEVVRLRQELWTH